MQTLYRASLFPLSSCLLSLNPPPKLWTHSFTINGHEICLVTWLIALSRPWEPSWREDVKLVTHHSMLIPEARLCSSNKQPAGPTVLPCFALLKLYWAQYVNSINTENDTGRCHQNCNQLIFFLNIFLNYKLPSLTWATSLHALF